MSVMVISNNERFIDMSKKLEDIGISNICFYHSGVNKKNKEQMINHLTFVDVVIVDKDTHYSKRFNQIVAEAQSRHIPVILDKCIGRLRGVEKEGV